MSESADPTQTDDKKEQTPQVNKKRTVSISVNSSALFYLRILAIAASITGLVGNAALINYYQTQPDMLINDISYHWTNYFYFYWVFSFLSFVILCIVVLRWVRKNNKDDLKYSIAIITTLLFNLLSSTVYIQIQTSVFDRLLLSQLDARVLGVFITAITCQSLLLVFTLYKGISGIIQRQREKKKLKKS